jgi:hypothetical protein
MTFFSVINLFRLFSRKIIFRNVFERGRIWFQLLISLISVILFSNPDYPRIQMKNQVLWILSLCDPTFNFAISKIISGFKKIILRRCCNGKQAYLERLSGVRVARSLVFFCVIFCRLLFGRCIVCPSSYGFWLPHWASDTSL